ncbi:MAG: tRNA-dihydrouridine synthase, partial [bacterium]
DKHIIKKGAGGALLKNLDNLTRILETMRKTTELPLSLKFRSGFDTENPVHLEILDIATQSELDMLIFHPASISHGRSGKSNWKLIKELKDRSRILIVGNGDIKSADDVFRMKEETGCDGIMIGRAGISHPWIFAYATHRLKNMAQIPLRIIIMDAYNKLSSNHLLSGIESDIDGILEFALLHLELLENEYGPLAQYFAIKEIPPYINGFASAKELRVKLYNTGGNIKKMRKLIQEFKDIMGRRLWDEVS